MPGVVSSECYGTPGPLVMVVLRAESESEVVSETVSETECLVAAFFVSGC